MAKSKSYLQGIADKLNPLSVVMSMAKPMLPQFKDYLANINRPVDQGGQLQGNEKLSYFSIMIIKGELEIVLVFLKIENGSLIVTRQVSMSNFQSILDNE